MGNRAAQLAQNEGRFDLACEALLIVGIAARRRSTDEAIDALKGALDLSRSHNLAVWEVQALAELGAIDMMAASDATRLEQARLLATAAGMPGTVAKIDITIAQTIIPRLGYRSAYQTIVRADTQARQLRLTSLHAQAHSHLAECLLFSWRRSAAWRVEAAAAEQRSTRSSRRPNPRREDPQTVLPRRHRRRARLA